MNNPKLKQRVQRANLMKIGSMFYYHPQAISKNKEIPDGEKLVIIEKPQGTGKYKTVKVAFVSKENYKYNNRGYYSSCEYVPNMDKTFVVLVNDLTKGKQTP